MMLLAILNNIIYVTKYFFFSHRFGWWPDFVLARISLFLGENAISSLFVKKKKAESEIGQMCPFLVRKDNLALMISRSKRFKFVILTSLKEDEKQKNNWVKTEEQKLPTFFHSSCHKSIFNALFCVLILWHICSSFAFLSLSISSIQRSTYLVYTFCVF